MSVKTLKRPRRSDFDQQSKASEWQWSILLVGAVCSILLAGIVLAVIISSGTSGRKAGGKEDGAAHIKAQKKVDNYIKNFKLSP